MMSKFRVHNEDLNTYGFWIKTDGIDLSGFKSNPIALWNHIESWRGSDDDILPIGFWDQIMVKDGEITMNFNHDPDDEFAVKIQKKIDNKVIRATSIGIQIIDCSEDPAMWKKGQTRPTVVKARLREVSIVDIPANKSAIVLYDKAGDVINLKENAEESLEKLFSNYNKAQAKTQPTMELKDIAQKLRLRSDADETQVLAAIAKLADENHDLGIDNARLKKENEQFQADHKKLRDTEIENILTSAIADGRFQEDQKATFRSILTADFDNGKKAIEAMNPVEKLSDFANASSKGVDTSGQILHKGKSFSELSKSDPKELAVLKERNPTFFKQLYKSEFGLEYKG